MNVNEKVDHPGNEKIDHPRDKKSESFWGFSCLSVVALLKAVRLPLEYQHMGMVSQSIQESVVREGTEKTSDHRENSRFEVMRRLPRS